MPLAAIHVKDRHQGRRQWTIWPLVFALLAVTAGVLATHNAWLDMYRIAMVDEESSHIFLVPIAVMWLVWGREGRFRQCQPHRSLIGTVLIGIGWLMWDRGYRGGDNGQIQSCFHLGAVLVAV